MPCLLDEREEALTIVGHVACEDPASREHDGPVLLIFHGPHGYVLASWYGTDTIPTWNHVTLHIRGTPERFDDPLPVLRRTVDHFEAAVEDPWSLDRMGETARQMADQVVAFRLRADSWHAEAKLSQDKPPEERARVLAGLERPGPYANGRWPPPCGPIARSLVPLVRGHLAVPRVLVARADLFVLLGRKLILGGLPPGRLCT